LLAGRLLGVQPVIQLLGWLAEYYSCRKTIAGQA